MWLSVGGKLFNEEDLIFLFKQPNLQVLELIQLQPAYEKRNAVDY